MKSLIFRAFSAALLIFLSAPGANAGDVVVITNPELSISSEEIKDVFLGEKQFAGSIKLVVIDNAAAQGAFLSKFMQMDAAKYNNIWTKKSFRDGLIPPAVKSSDAEVIEYIKRTPGSIGYVSSTPAGVKIIQKP
jgi:ABC-type phosphate transport system substrate-binding protein